VHGPVRLDEDVEAIVLDPCFAGTDIEYAARRLGCEVEFHLGFQVDAASLDPDYRGPESVALAQQFGARLTPDLRRARVFYTALGDEGERRATRAGLRSAAGHLRKVLGNEVRIKFLPELEFEEDQTEIRAGRVNQLLRKIQENHGST
jgi:hypothetical protein